MVSLCTSRKFLEIDFRGDKKESGSRLSLGQQHHAGTTQLSHAGDINHGGPQRRVGGDERSEEDQDEDASENEEDEGDEEDEDGSEEETDEDICEDIRVSSTFFSVFEAVW